MASDRLLSQDEIDSVFRNLQGTTNEEDPARKAQPYDFRRPDRIAKDQLRAIHLLHDNFARSLASSLSAYLRAYVMVNLISVEQLSFLEFSQCLPAPTCIVSLSMRPFDGNAVLELNPTMVFPILEMLLGGSGKTPYKVTREITEIEQSILDGLFRIILHDLREAWSPISQINFAIEAHETEPQLLQILAPNEAVVTVGMEIRIGEVAGMMNLGIPSIIIKMLRQKFDQQWSVRKSESTEEEQARILRLIKPAQLKFDARLQGPSLTVEQMLGLQPDDVVEFDFPVNRPVNLLVNGALKFNGRIVNTGRKRAFHIMADQSEE
ncbi:flagellar motor switch protein FliM [Paludibaculum fermentans]|uniref:Flagellar motor switch protein FliM n=1 Tax=Paludibaculum fermentans TaxID=1473598 RepID=A0A7S7SM12_PALFE|nr:flagellar motor switch protein FliM [Paludibaculum fermentans]QOY89031.1 flagellar motor switch protein FliM [Paludibaculum fermentans]